MLRVTSGKPTLPLVRVLNDGYASFVYQLLRFEWAIVRCASHSKVTGQWCFIGQPCAAVPAQRMQRGSARALVFVFNMPHDQIHNPIRCTQTFPVFSSSSPWVNLEFHIQDVTSAMYRSASGLGTIATTAVKLKPTNGYAYCSSHGTHMLIVALVQ